MLTHRLDFSQFALAALVALLLASLYTGATWIQLDQAQLRIDRALPDLEALQRRPLEYPDVFMRLAQLVPLLRAADVPVDELIASSEQTKDVWLAGRSVRASSTLLREHIDQARLRARSRSELTLLEKQSRLRQLVLLQVIMLLAFAAALSLLRPRQSHAGKGGELSRRVDSLLFANVPVPVIYSDARQRIVDVNDAYEVMSGYSREECLGRNVDFNLSGQQDRRFFGDMRERLNRDGRFSGELWLRHRNGEAFADRITRLVVRGEEDRLLGHLTVSTDPMKSDASKRLMLWQAHHDPLTKLPNRNLIEERLAQSIVNPAWPCALLSINLDRFKTLNDSVGPAQGDQLLIAAAHRLAMCACETDTVARIAADHFVVLLGNGSGQQEAEAVARSIVREFRQPFPLLDRELFLGASVGIALFPKDGDTVGDLMQKADAACALVKGKGGNNLGLFQPDINSRAARRLEVEIQLREAIAREQFELHLQPIVRVSDNANDVGTVVGAEALLRWEHPDLGFVSPGEFIPIAESAHLITDIGLWVVREAGEILRAWQAQGLAHLRLSLNVSAAQIADAHRVATFLEALDRIDHQRVTVELTETALVHDAAGARAFLEALAERGCAAALDDFGTGFSSLGYLRDYRFDVLKIDKVFVDRMDDARDQALFRSILTLGSSLGMRCVAEGVETAAQCEQLRSMGCEYLQGYYLSRPLPAAAFVEFATTPEPF